MAEAVRGEPAQDERRRGRGEGQGDPTRRGDGHLTVEDPRRGEDQPAEEGVRDAGVLGQDRLDPPGEDDQHGHHANAEGHQEGDVHREEVLIQRLPIRGAVQPAEVGERPGVQRRDRGDQPVVDAGDERDRAPGDAGDGLGHAHGHPGGDDPDGLAHGGVTGPVARGRRSPPPR